MYTELDCAVLELLDEGRCLCELRLTGDEAEILRARGACLRELAGAGDKRWYAVSFAEGCHVS